MKNKIETLINRLGYYKHKQTFTESEAAEIFAKSIGDVNDYNIKATKQQELFEKLTGVEGFTDWLRATAARDIQRYFAAEDEKVRDTVKGAASRTAYMRSLIGRKKEIENNTSIPGLRYKK